MKVGDKLFYTFNEFDGRGYYQGVVSEVEKDHFILLADGMKLWIDFIDTDMYCWTEKEAKERTRRK